VGSGIRQDLCVLAGVTLFGKELGLSLDWVVERCLDCGGRKVPIQLDELVDVDVVAFAVVVVTVEVIVVVVLILSGSHRFFEKLDCLPAAGKRPSKVDWVGIVFERHALCRPLPRGSCLVVSVMMLLLL
jgi:hypothetical protein